jgi:4-hydroxy-4-methyl-2-oxoglutarate aldolase
MVSLLRRVHPLRFNRMGTCHCSRPLTDIPDRPYGGEINFISSLNVGDVVVLDCSYKPAAAWGELFSTAFVGRRTRGAIVDGLIRDKRLIDKLDRFPVFGRGLRPTDSLGRVAIAEYDIPVCVFGFTVHPGDLVVCGSDGSIVISRDHAHEIMKKAC